MKRLFVLSIFLLSSLGLSAAPAKLSVWGNIAVPGADAAVTGFDLGLVSSTAQMRGLQADVFYAYSEEMNGVQIALVNRLVTGAGAQIGLVNIITGDAAGLQAGFINYSERIRGLQIGFINYSERLDGALQIGFVNFARNGYAPVMLFLNARF